MNPSIKSGAKKRINLWLPVCFVLLIGLAAAAALPSSAEPFQFPEVAGWKLDENIQTYLPDNLYDYINGAAEAYLSYEFQELQVAEYKNSAGESVMVEIYRHKSPAHGFGIYSQERPTKGEFLEIGAQGYGEEMILNFFKGAYYIKINNFNQSPENRKILQTFAKSIAGKLDSEGGLPPILNSFPLEGKIANSEKFIHENFLGYNFLRNGYLAEYETDGEKFKIFIISNESPVQSLDMMKKYYQKLKLADKPIEPGRHKLKDPYHGVIHISWQGRYIIGIQNLDEEQLLEQYLSKIKLPGGK